VDFDESVYKSGDTDTTDSKIKKTKSETKMENTEAHTDLTAQQNKDNYWHTTKETKLDGSTVMMETRISKLMEATGMSREAASKEVKKRMKKAGSENTNTEDMTEDAQKKEKKEKVYDDDDKEEGEEVEADKSEKKDTLEETKRKERFDFLEAFFNENKEKEDKSAARLDALEATIKQYQELESAKLDTQLEERILKFATDFLVPEEEIVKKLDGKKGKEGLKYVQDLEDILNLSSKKPEDKKADGTYDMTDYLAQAETQAQKVRDSLRHS